MNADVPRPGDSGVSVMLRRAATASRNIQTKATGDKAWFDWVPKYLDRLADLLVPKGYEPALRCLRCGHFMLPHDVEGHERWHDEPNR